MIALGGALFGFLEAVGLALDGDDFGLVQEAIDEGDDAGGVGEDLVPLGEGAVGGDDGAPELVAAVGEFEQQIGVAVGVGEVAELVDAEQVEGGEVAQTARQGGGGVGGGEFAEQGAGAAECPSRRAW